MYNYTIPEGSMEEKMEEAELLQATATGRSDDTGHPVPDAAQTARRTPGDECYSGRTSNEYRTSDESQRPDDRRRPDDWCHYTREESMDIRRALDVQTVLRHRSSRTYLAQPRVFGLVPLSHLPLRG